MEINKEKNVKLILALLVVISHLPLGYVIERFNYLFVAGFFFFSGYGLMKKNLLKKNFSIIKSLKKIYIPYIISALLFIILFKKISMTVIIKNVLLINLDLPYSWYIRTIIILYIFWYFGLFGKSDNKKIIIVSILVLIYIIISYCTGQIFTSYKTVAAFIFGLIYALYENKIRELEKNRLLLGLIPLFLIQSYFLVKQESIISFILFNMNGIIFSYFLTIIINKSNLKNKSKTVNFLREYYYEIYLVQGISQCFITKTYFCDKSYLYLENRLLILLFSFIGTILLAYILKNIEKIIFKKEGI